MQRNSEKATRLQNWPKKDKRMCKNKMKWRTNEIVFSCIVKLIKIRRNKTSCTSKWGFFRIVFEGDLRTINDILDNTAVQLAGALTPVFLA